jgi:hypothetical protein
VAVGQPVLLVGIMEPQVQQGLDISLVVVAEVAVQTLVAQEVLEEQVVKAEAAAAAVVVPLLLLAEQVELAEQGMSQFGQYRRIRWQNT